MLCDETKELTADISISHERVITLSFLFPKDVGGRASEKCSIIANRKSTIAFQRAIDELHTLPLTPPNGGLKSEFVVFVNKIRVQWNKVCYKVSLCENFQCQSLVEPFAYLMVYRC